MGLAILGLLLKIGADQISKRCHIARNALEPNGFEQPAQIAGRALI
jgi:hypothetical protein